MDPTVTRSSNGPAAAAEPSRADGGRLAALGAAEWPEFPELQSLNGNFPPLHTPGARTVARDRWERLVTSADLPHPPDAVWRALVDPEALRLWLAVCHGSLERPGAEATLDFEDGEFFYCHVLEAEAPRRLRWLWRWLGVGQATSVTWALEPAERGTRLTAVEEGFNPPWDWQTWNGGGWPGILDQLAAHLRTGTSWRWPWRRMGPYAQVELPLPFADAWYRLLNPAGLRYWLGLMDGVFAPRETVTVLMGDASGAMQLTVRDVVEPGQRPPSFLPAVDFTLRRPAWGEAEVGGRIWMEPAGWGKCLLQAVHYNWESLPGELQLSERRLVASFWAGAVRRAALMCGAGQARTGGHSWS